MDWGASRMHNDESDPVSRTTVVMVTSGRIFYLFILSYRARLSYQTALVLSLLFIYGCGLVSS